MLCCENDNEHNNTDVILKVPSLTLSRDNIDPEGKRTDAELNDALNLIQSSTSASSNLKDKFHLDAAVHAEGANFSAGEKQLRKCLVWRRRVCG